MLSGLGFYNSKDNVRAPECMTQEHSRLFSAAEGMTNQAKATCSLSTSYT